MSRSRTRDLEPKVRDVVEIPIGYDGVKARFHTFENLADGEEHLLVAFGQHNLQHPLVRIHSECLTGDLFGSLRCDCGPQLESAIAGLSRDGGYLLYMRHEGRGIGLYPKLAAYRLQDLGFDTYSANRHLGFPDDLRDYRPAAEMLLAVGIDSVRLITNNPDKVQQLEKHGVRVDERVSTGVYLTPYNRAYLEAKMEQAGHFLKLV